MTRLLKEFAIEPSAISDWRSARYIIESCGVSSGRMVSKYPAHWVGVLNTLLKNCKGNDRYRIKSLLARQNCLLASKHRTYNTNSTWPDNARSEHAIKPFAGIVFKEPHVEIKHTASVDELDRSLEWWNVSRDAVIPRTADAIAEAASDLLRMSKQILFVDPHFKPDEMRFIRPLVKMLEYALQGRPPARIEYHLEAQAVANAFDFQKCLEKKLMPHLSMLPDGRALNVVRWRSLYPEKHPNKPIDYMHPRYVLTELGGIRYDYGLDEGFKASATTDVGLLDEGTYRVRWSQMQANSGAFAFANGWAVHPSEIYPIEPVRGNFIRSGS